MRRFYTTFTYPSIPILIILLIYLKNLKVFKFAEIGVFKGDNALLVGETVFKRNRQLKYVGFDLFEESEVFYKENSTDYEIFQAEDVPYWEHKSMGHGWNTIQKKIASLVPQDDYLLIKGNSLETVPENEEKLEGFDLIYIDGAHDYKFVVKDWENVKPLFKTKPNLMVVFDDLGFEGVKQVKDEIEAEGRFLTYYLNHNQFYVLSSECPGLDRIFFRMASIYFKSILVFKKVITGGRRKA